MALKHWMKPETHLFMSGILIGMTIAITGIVDAVSEMRNMRASPTVKIVCFVFALVFVIFFAAMVSLTLRIIGGGENAETH